MYDTVDVVHGRKTTPNSTELRPNFGRIAQRCRAESSRIIQSKFGETELRPISTSSVVASVMQQSRHRVPRAWTEYRECPKATFTLV